MKKIILISMLLASLPISVAWSNLPASDAVINQVSNSAAEQIARAAEIPADAGAEMPATSTDNVLSEQEAADLLYMREEEKLAHDVYVYLYDLWGLPVFNNIAASELTHTTSVLSLLTRYGIADPAKGLGPGQFNNTDLQDLYNQLIRQGSTSLSAALKVGAAIEEIDILDLQEASAYTSQADIRLVYDNLLAGSGNHLRAFVSSLQQQTGEIYQPHYLSKEDYQVILSATNTSGVGNGAQGQAGGKGQGNPNRK